MLWLYVSTANSFFAYSCTAFAKGEPGRLIEETAIGFAGVEEACDCSSRVEIFRGTAVQPYFSIAGLLILTYGIRKSKKKVSENEKGLK